MRKINKFNKARPNFCKIKIKFAQFFVVSKVLFVNYFYKHNFQKKFWKIILINFLQKKYISLYSAQDIETYFKGSIIPVNSFGHIQTKKISTKLHYFINVNAFQLAL